VVELPAPAVRRDPAGADAAPAAVHRTSLLAPLLAIAIGLGVLATLASALVFPVLLPFAVPLVALAAAGALWAVARVEQNRVHADVARLAADNRRLGERLEHISDTAWELRESEERYRGLIDAQGDLVVVRDAAGVVTFANAAFAAAFAAPAATLVGKPLAVASLAGVLAGTTAEAGGKAAPSRDVRIDTPAGPRWYAWVDIPVRDAGGVVTATYSVGRDVTARKDVEQALDEARRRAEAASQAKSRLLATVSHEFRTPLNGILGLTGLLLETALTADQETYARAVHSSGEALLALVDDMLDFSKIEAGRLDLAPEAADLDGVLQEIAELLASRAHSRGIDVAAEVAADVPAVMIDAARLRQVLLNLAGNGVKFTEHGGVTLSARLLRLGQGRAEVEFAVADSGPGIPAAEAERLFGEFEQLDSALTRRHGGAGLGLAISRRIVRRMGGEIALAPRPGGGSVFSFRLDLALAAAAIAEVQPDLAGLSVLILAPTGSEPPVLARHLAAAGASARLAATANVAAALAGAAAAAGQGYDVALIDARLDAAAALAQLRAAAGRRLAAAVLIEPGRRGDVRGLRTAGFDAYLVRPLRRSSLLRIVADLAAGEGGFRIDPGDARQRPAVPVRRAGASLKVLLAEDNEINALLARAVLEGLGHVVEEVHDGTAAVAAATAAPRRFPVILMDLHMPGLDGLAAVKAIRAHERAHDLPPATILAVTADVLAETRAAAEAAGIDAVLEKPMTPDALRRALARAATAA
jgi:PAS domain S-box-containing protein